MMLKNLLLWDIDGTLIELNENRFSSHFRAFNIVTNQKVQLNVSTSGMTDVQIMVKLLEVNNMKIHKSIIDSLLNQLNEITCRDIMKYPSKPSSNIYSTLIRTQQEKWINGILTGNTKIRAKIKLSNTNIYDKVNFEFGFFGDTAIDRIELVRNCKNKLISHKINKIVLIGDTPIDIQSAKYNNLPIVAVSTGKYNLTDLKTHKPNLVVSSLNEGFDTFFQFLSEIRTQKDKS